MTAAFTVPLTLFIAAPLCYVWRRRITFLRCLVAGFVIGALGALAFLVMTNAQAALNWSPGLIGAGVVTSIIFWAIAVWNNSNIGGAASPGAGDAAI
jgi:hypothetical protein